MIFTTSNSGFPCRKWGRVRPPQTCSRCHRSDLLYRSHYNLLWYCIRL